MRRSGGDATTTATVPDGRSLTSEIREIAAHFEHEVCNHSSNVTHHTINNTPTASGKPQTAAQAHSLYHGLPCELYVGLARNRTSCGACITPEARIVSSRELGNLAGAPGNYIKQCFNERHVRPVMLTVISSNEQRAKRPTVVQVPLLCVLPEER